MNQRRVSYLVIAASGFAASAGLARADIVAVGGAVVLSEPPADITNGIWRSDTEIRGWFERQTTLASNLTLDHVNTGLVSDAAQLVPGTITAGTAVRSYMFRLDPASGHTTTTLSGFVVFDTPILGVLEDRATLGGTDNLLGRAGVVYNVNNNRGMELGPAEYFMISADRLRIDFVMVVTDAPTDDIRIVTAASVPSPAYALPLATAGMAIRRRRR